MRWWIELEAWRSETKNAVRSGCAIGLVALLFLLPVLTGAAMLLPTFCMDLHN